MFDEDTTPNRAAQLLQTVENARIVLVDRLVELDRCTDYNYRAAAFGVLLSYLRLVRENKAAATALRQLEKRGNVLGKIPDAEPLCTTEEFPDA